MKLKSAMENSRGCMKWILQQEGNGLGNFIMMTPALRLMYLRSRRPMPVFFETKSIAKLFEKCPFLKVIQKRPGCHHYYSSDPPEKKSQDFPSEDVKRFIGMSEGNPLVFSQGEEFAPPFSYK